MKTMIGRQWINLAVVLSGAFMAILDVSVVNVSMPSIKSDLHTSIGATELVVSSYTLLYASFLVTGGRLGDFAGRRRMFLIGIAVFTTASALCGMAPTVTVLIAARMLQGVGGALLYPQVLAIIQVSFEAPERNRALGVFGCVIGVGAIAGQIVGGLLMAADVLGLGWRPSFLINVPIGLLTLVAGRLLLPADRPQEARTRLDWGGSALSVATLALLIVPMLMGRDLGWPAWILVCLVASAPVAAWFLFHERATARRGHDPLVHLDLFRNRGFARGVPIAALFSFSYVGFMMTFAIYLQIGLGLSPLHAALVYTPNAIGFLISSLLAARLVPLLGRHVLTLGYLVGAFGLLATVAAAAAAGPGLAGWELAAPLFVAGLGQGLGMTPLIGTVIGALTPREAGSGAGVVTTTLQVGNALGVAVLSFAFFAFLGSGHGSPAYVGAFTRVLPLSAAAMLVAAVMVIRLPHDQRRAGNLLLGHQHDLTAGFGYSMFLMTGGRVGDRLFAATLGRVTERRERQIAQAPRSAGEFLAYHFTEAGQDSSWLAYLMREALSYGDRSVPHEQERTEVIQEQVDEVRRRQSDGELPADLDPELLRLFAFALTNYPHLLPQITRMSTGLSPHDPEFAERWTRFLRQLGLLLQAERSSSGVHLDPSARS